ncbi:hypothetical protein SMAC4_14120 [Sordaria macrospora]|uniref:uncharacterized protein n=1 Tax=Sordaria macrospora TaxID=5147 RepID=UPI002B2A4138|nr:hypothetical protein SMAC4_14120 [Sordaria macrospora]
MKSIQATLKDDKVTTTLSINGWDQDSTDPKYLYDLIRKTVGKVTNEARADILEEYTSLRRANFNSMASFLVCYDLLRNRVAECGLKINEKVEVLNLYNMVKRQYTVDAKFWAAEMAKDKLTTLQLLSHLSILGNTEARMTNLTVQVKKTTSTASTNDKKDSNNKNDKDRTNHKQVTCSDCGQSMRDDFKHFPCGHHRNPRTADCWWCDPDTAPANWSRKKEPIARSNHVDSSNSTAKYQLQHSTCNIAEVQQAPEATNPMKDLVVYDSGCGSNVFNHVRWFTDLQPLPEPPKHTIGDGTVILSYHIGTVELTMPTNKKVNVRVRIKDVIYSPSTPANLLSTKALLESGLIWDMKTNQIHLQNQKCTIRCDYINGLVVLPVIQPFNFNQSRIETKDVMLASINYSTMHKRMMHAGREQVITIWDNDTVSTSFVKPLVITGLTSVQPRARHLLN